MYTNLTLALTLFLLPYLGEPTTSSKNEEEIVVCCGDSSQVDHALARAFAESPSDPTLKSRAFELLTAKLDDWQAHGNGAVTDILDIIGSHRIEAGKPLVEKFLMIDTGLSGSISVKRAAIVALGKLGGKGVVPLLKKLAADGPPEVRRSVATALGSLKQSEAVTVLEELSADPEAGVRYRALANLSKYCSHSSREYAIANIDDGDAMVRLAAVGWFSICGTDEDASFLVIGMRDEEDRDGMIRIRSLEGLIRLSSKAGCPYLNRLLTTSDANVRSIAAAYAESCRRAD